MITEQSIREWQHDMIRANAPNVITMTVEHLTYRQGEIRKIADVDCEECERSGLNDGQWHDL